MSLLTEDFCTNHNNADIPLITRVTDMTGQVMAKPYEIQGDITHMSRERAKKAGPILPEGSQLRPRYSTITILGAPSKIPMKLAVKIMTQLKDRLNLSEPLTIVDSKDVNKTEGNKISLPFTATSVRDLRKTVEWRRTIQCDMTKEEDHQELFQKTHENKIDPPAGSCTMQVVKNFGNPSTIQHSLGN